MSVPGILVCSSFLISVCMFFVLKDLLISSDPVIVRVGGAIRLNPVDMVLFNVCSAVTVLCFVPNRLPFFQINLFIFIHGRLCRELDGI